MTLQELIENELKYECRSYSGRGMYGKECLGVTLKQHQNMLQFGMELGGGLVEHEMKQPRRVQYDSMGLGMIVYFPFETYTPGTPMPGVVCSDCGRSVTEREYSRGTSNCCNEAVCGEEEYKG